MFVVAHELPLVDTGITKAFSLKNEALQSLVTNQGRLGTDLEPQAPKALQLMLALH